MTMNMRLNGFTYLISLNMLVFWSGLLGLFLATSGGGAKNLESNFPIFDTKMFERHGRHLDSTSLFRAG